MAEHGPDWRVDALPPTLAAALLQTPNVMAGVLEPLDGDYRYLNANASACAFHRRRPGELDGMSARSLGVPESHIARRLTVLRRCLAQRSSEVVEGVLHLEGQPPGWFMAVFAPIPGTPGQVGFIALDISQNRRRRRHAEGEGHRLALALDAAHLGVWDYDPAAGLLELDTRLRELLDIEAEQAVDLRLYRDRVHAEDWPRVKTATLAAMSSPEAPDYTLEHRIVRRGGEVCWIRSAGRVLFDGAGVPERILGAAQDISEQMRVRERQDLLVGEMNHRVKNSLANVHAIVEHSWRASGGEAQAFRQRVHQRLDALSRAHDVIAANAWSHTEMAEIVAAAMAPFSAEAMVIAGPVEGLKVKPEAGLSLIMTLHELATNAAKYGALSTARGQVQISWRRLDQDIELLWREVAGPPVRPPERQGFGSRLLGNALRGHGGGAWLTFAPEGVTCRLTLPTA